jgi:hypothetical protein
VPGVQGLRTVFTVYPDNTGTVSHYHPDGDMYTVNVTCVSIDGNEAWFGGTVTTATGIYSTRTTGLFWVEDNGPDGGDPYDRIGSPGATASCSNIGWTGGGVVTAGDLTVN